MSKIERNREEGFGFDDVQYTDNIIICSTDGIIISIPESMKNVIGADCEGRDVSEVFDPVAAKTIKDLSQKRQFADFECYIINSEYSCSAQLIKDKIYIYCFPIERNAAIPKRDSSMQFASREINTATSMIFASLGILKKDIEKNGTKEPLAIINKNLYRLLRLSRNMMDSSQIEENSLSLCLSEEDIAAFCLKIVKQVEDICSQCDIVFTFDIPEKSIICCFDKEKIERAILNLLSNAISACGKDGRIHFSLTEKEKDVIIVITDNGAGIDGGVLSDVFEKHKAGRPESGISLGGAGFGLELVKAFIEKHGGSIVITSQENMGTSACIVLPKNEGVKPAVFNSAAFDYAGGFSHVLVELSTVLDKKFFMP